MSATRILDSGEVDILGSILRPRDAGQQSTSRRHKSTAHSEFLFQQKRTVRSRYKRIVYKRIRVASLPFQPVWATFASY